MPPFAAPVFSYAYTPAEQVRLLRKWRDEEPGRAIPGKEADRLLLGSWNIANLGDSGQVRADGDIVLIAEILSWFDLIAVQEVKEDLTDLFRVMAHLPGYDAVMTDQTGNDERMVFLYDTARVDRLQLAGEIDIPPAQARYVTLPGTEQRFDGFDRAPYGVAFRCGDAVFTVVNVHLYFGSTSKRSVNRRALECYAVGRWADLRRQRGRAYSQNLVVIGDMNMPAAEPGDEVYDALRKRGLFVPEHQSRIGTTITEGKFYDQMAFFPGDAGRARVASGVFDFDGAVFPDLWDEDHPQDFAAYVRYHLSDHRPIWVQFRTDQG